MRYALIMLLCLPVFAQEPVPTNKALEIIFSIACPQKQHNFAEKVRAAGHLHKFKFSDESGVSAMLASHCEQYFGMIDARNKAVQKAIDDSIKDGVDRTDDGSKFLLNLALLVGDTADEIRYTYPQDWEHFMEQVEVEKGFMSTAEETPMLIGLRDPEGVPHHHDRKLLPINSQTTTTIDSFGGYGYTYYYAILDDGYQLWQTIGVTGTSNTAFCTWDSYHQMWMPPPCPNVYHTPSVQYNTSGGAPNPDNEGGTYTGTSLLPSQYMSWQTSTNPSGWNFYGPSMEGPPVTKQTITGLAKMSCTIAGVIISWPLSYQLTDVYTKGYVYPNGPPWPTPCPATPWCTAATSPPLYNFNKLIPLTPSACKAPYWDGYEVYVSHSHQPWRDTGVGYAWVTTSGTDKAKCTVLGDLPTP